MTDAALHLFDPGPTVLPELPDDAEKLSADRRRTIRRQLAFDRGVHPTTKVPLLDEPGATCGNCAQLYGNHGHASTYWKCGAVPRTGGPATDVRLKWPACDKWQPQQEAAGA